ARVVAVGRVVQAQLHEAGERDRPAGCDLREDFGFETVRDVGDRHRQEPVRILGRVAAPGRDFPRPAFARSSTSRWTCMIPSIRASGRGGQPGMYTSTGMISSTPCTTG